MKRKSVFFAVACCAVVSSFGADIVHSPYAAFVANYNGGSFSNGPQIDANGGIWTYGYRGTIASTTLNSFSAAKFKRAASDLGGLNKQVGSDFMPYVVINPTVGNVSDSGASPYRAITPGNEFVTQPGNLMEGTEGLRGVPVIRFTAPRAGRYSVTAICESLSSGTGSDGVVSFHLLSNGTILEQRDVEHRSSYTFSCSDLLLGQNETIELVTGPGMVAKKNKISYACDSSSVKIEIVEKEGTAYSLGDDMANNILAGNQDNPFCNGRWTAGQYTRRSLTDLFPNNGAITALKWGFNRETYHVGYSEAGTTARDAVYTCVNTNETAKNIVGSYPLATHEIMVLPAGLRNAAYRFTTPEDGTWRVTAIVRNLQASVNGISAYLFAGGHRYAAEQLVGDKTAKTRTLTAVTSKMKAGAFIDLVIDSNGDNGSDTTALKMYVEKVDDTLCPHDDGGLSFNTEMKKLTNATNPFTDARGVQWEIGQAAGATGTFTKLPFYLERVPGYLAGWTPKSGTTLPRLQANYNGVLATNGGTLGLDGNEVLYDDEFYLHPAKNQYGVLRYSAPSTGVYRVWACCRDVALGDPGMEAPGVFCHVTANGNCVESAFACHAQTNRVPAGTGAVVSRDEVAFLEPRLLYLNANEPLDLRVGITRDAKSDATAVSCRIAPDGGFEESFVNVDFKATAAAAYTGRGRLGWASPRWNALVGSGTAASRANLRDATGLRTAMTLSVTHGGAAIATSTSSSGNALLASGLKSTGTSDVYAFTVGGLKAGEKYRLCLYGGEQGTGSARAVFTVGGVTQTAASYWLRADIPEVAIIDATADANGEIAGTFAAQDANPAVFFGLQVGGSFDAAAPTGLMILFK